MPPLTFACSAASIETCPAGVVDFLEQYPKTIRPMHAEYVSATRENADLVLDGCHLDEASIRFGERLRPKLVGVT